MEGFDESGSVIERFKVRRTRQYLAAVPTVLALFGLFYFAENPDATIGDLPSNIVLGGLLVVILGCLAFSVFNWRCPSCNGYLGKAINPKFCSRCGNALQEQ